MALRILHIIDTGGAGGAESVLSNIAGGLDPERYSSRILVPGEGWLHARLSGEGLDVRIIPRHRSPDLRFLRAIGAHIREQGTDVVHTHLLGSAVYGTLAALTSSDTPLVATFHGLPDVPEGERFGPLKGRLLARARNRLVFVAEHLRPRLLARLGLGPSHGMTIHNGIPLSPRSTATRRRDGCIRIGAVGNLRPAKDYPTLLRAAADVVRKLPRARFLIAGSGSVEALRQIHALRDELALQEHVEFLGHVDDVSSFLDSLDLFISSSRTEGLPLSIVEAASRGLPVVATRSGGSEEVLGLGSEECFAPARDPQALASQVCRALADPERLQRSETIGEAVRRHFDVTRMVAEYTGVYEELARRYPARRWG